MSLLLERLSRGHIDLAPSFRAPSKNWDEATQSRFIESALLGIPLPAIYAADAGDTDWAVLDGAQRITALAQFIKPELLDTEPLRLRGLEFLPYEGQTHNDLRDPLRRRLEQTHITVHILRPGAPDGVLASLARRLHGH
ncbi:DUF262 domain-containing protein [Spirillospora sp. NPDC127200]